MYAHRHIASGSAGNEIAQTAGGLVHTLMQTGDPTAGGILADYLQDNDSPFSDVVRRIHSGEAQEIDPYSLDRSLPDQYNSARAFRNPRYDVPYVPDLHINLPHFDNSKSRLADPNTAVMKAHYLNHPKGHFFDVRLHGADFEVGRRYLVPTTPEEVRQIAQHFLAGNEYDRENGHHLLRTLQLAPGEREQAHPDWAALEGPAEVSENLGDAPPPAPPAHFARKFAAWRAPAGGMISRGTYIPGGKFAPDLEGKFMNPPQQPLKLDHKKVEAARQRWKKRKKVIKVPYDTDTNATDNSTAAVACQRAAKASPRKFSASEHRAFVKAIKNGDLAARKVYADYLEERGEHGGPQTLEFLRNSDAPIWIAKGSDGKVHAGRRWSLAEIRAHNQSRGGNWFSPDTRRFFGSRTHGDAINGPGGTYFISSEYTGFDRTGRAFTVRKFDPSDEADRRGQMIGEGEGEEFLGHPDLQSARERARELAAQVPQAEQPPPQQLARSLSRVRK